MHHLSKQKKMKKKDSNKKTKNEMKTMAEALRFNVNWKAKTVYPSMTEQVSIRIENELVWIIQNGLQKGFMQLKEISDAANEIIGSYIAPDHGILADSVVAFCLGLVGEDPINRKMAVLDSEAPQFLNVSIHFTPEKRNEVVKWAEQRFGIKAMTRMGVYIIKLDRIILEFHRDMKCLSSKAAKVDETTSDEIKIQGMLEESSQYHHLISDSIYINKLILRVQKGDTNAEMELKQSYRHIILSLINSNYLNSGFEIEELVDSANVGLIEAAKRYKADGKFIFIAHAVWWIKESMKQYVNNK